MTAESEKQQRTRLAAGRLTKDQIRRSQGFDRNPPRCATCIHTLKDKRQPPKRFGLCRVGWFPVKPHSVCDRWTNARGETVEA